MRKFLMITLAVIVLGLVSYFTFLYNATYSEGVRSGELIKVSNKGVILKPGKAKSVKESQVHKYFHFLF